MNARVSRHVRKTLNAMRLKDMEKIKKFLSDSSTWSMRDRLTMAFGVIFKKYKKK